MNVQSLQAVADWNAERGCALYRQSQFEKNHDRSRLMLSDFARHIRTADTLRRQAWVIEHTRRKK